MDEYAIIMSGGRGKRFWPLSQVAFPKQFLSFTGEGSLFLQTFQNLRQLMPADHIFTVTRQVYRSIILDQVKDFLSGNVIVEPIQNNTGPCIALGLSYIIHRTSDAVVVILPADHYVENKAKFANALSCALEYARECAGIVTFGIKPDVPHTGYGYIQSGDSIGTRDGFEILKGKRFIEKPNLETARELLKQSDYHWNSGIFCAQLTVFEDAYRHHLPEVYRNIQDFRRYIGTPQEGEKLLEVYKRMPRISIDYGIMERADQVAVIPIDVGWNDVGSWSSLRKLHAPDDDDNLVLGNHYLLETKGSTVISDVKVIAIGVDDLIIASNGDYILVCARNQEHRIQNIVDHLEEEE